LISILKDLAIAGFAMHLAAGAFHSIFNYRTAIDASSNSLKSLHLLKRCKLFYNRKGKLLQRISHGPCCGAMVVMK
jgi:hypothetical protein